MVDEQGGVERFEVAGAVRRRARKTQHPRPTMTRRPCREVCRRSYRPRAVRSTRLLELKILELYFSARVLDDIFANAEQRQKTGKPLAQTFVTQLPAIWK